MKRVNHLYEKMISEENLRLAILEVNMTHRWYPRHRPNKTVAMIERDLPHYVDELRKVLDGLIDGTSVLSPPKQRVRWDKSAGKERNINEPMLWPDQYVHHALIQVLQPVMMRGMDDFCCGSIRGRGIHYGVKAMQKWMKNGRSDVKYCAELDIHHFYDSIKPQYVVDRMKCLIKDRRVLKLIEEILRPGVLIGVYCSQWFANTLLQPLDQMIRQSGLCAHYMRYMDNFSILGSNKRKLRKLVALVSTWLGGIELRLKSNWQIFPTSARLPSALGFRFGRGYTLLRKRNRLRLTRQLRVYAKKRSQRKRISVHLAAGLLSRLGQLKYCRHTYFYQTYYRPKTQKRLKQVVREHAEKERLKWSTFSGPMNRNGASC